MAVSDSGNWSLTTCSAGSVPAVLVVVLVPVLVLVLVLVKEVHPRGGASPIGISNPVERSGGRAGTVSFVPGSAVRKIN